MNLMIMVLRNTLRGLTAPLLLLCLGTALRADPAEATITAPTGAITVMTNQTVSFAATSTDSNNRNNYTVTGFNWTFGDGGTGSGAQINHPYSSPGTYTATLTVSYTCVVCQGAVNPDGSCKKTVVKSFNATATRIVTVVAPPLSINSFTANPSTVRAGAAVILSWSTSNATSWSISGIGSVTGTSTTIFPGATTIYTLTATGPSGSASQSLTVSVYSVSVSLSPNSVTIPLGGSQTFFGAASPANQGITWSATGGSLSGSTFTGTSPGSYTVTATSIEDPAKSANATVTVTPASVGTPSPANSSVNAGSTVQYSASVSGAVNTGVIWSVSGGGSISGSGLFTATSPGTYFVTAASAADITKSASTTVTVNSVVAGVIVTPATPSALNPGDTLKFTAVVSGLGIGDTGVAWRASSGSIAADGTFNSAGASGDVIITATSNQDPTKTAAVVVHVKGWVMKWKRDISYLGTQEVAEFDANGMHVTHLDHAGSPRMITNASGKSESRQKYLPFGETLDQTGPLKTAKGYTNHEQTDSSGLIYMQARFYAPQWHRFTSPDPARDQHLEETQSWNIYSYVQNAPTMRFDPTGMIWLPNNLGMNAVDDAGGGQGPSGGSGSYDAALTEAADAKGNDDQKNAAQTNIDHAPGAQSAASDSKLTEAQPDKTVFSGKNAIEHAVEYGFNFIQSNFDTTKREYGFLVYKAGDGYAISSIVQGAPMEVDYSVAHSSIPKGSLLVGNAHTHPIFSKGETVTPSGGDLRNVRFKRGYGESGEMKDGFRYSRNYTGYLQNATNPRSVLTYSGPAYVAGKPYDYDSVTYGGWSYR